MTRQIEFAIFCQSFIPSFIRRRLRGSSAETRTGAKPVGWSLKGLLCGASSAGGHTVDLANDSASFLESYALDVNLSFERGH